MTDLNIADLNGSGPIAVIGLGYVGLPLAVEFGKKRPVIGFDINTERIRKLEEGTDHTREVSVEELLEARHLSFTSDASRLADANIFIVTVPTPVDAHKRPDLTSLIRASETVGSALKRGDIVIYESTVYPGATEEDCVPILEARSGLQFNLDFYCGYSPERINPGDKTRRLTTIKKIVAGSTPAALDLVEEIYGGIVDAGLYRAESIRVAEAAKVIENTQRDINIALINELAIIFNRMGIDTEAVLNAAETKWNFIRFRPGLVGGHCIGVDPYYLTHKAEEFGYHSQVILSGRRINDSMGQYASDQLIKEMLRRRIQVAGSRVLVMGLTFKENCPDLRNTRVVDIVRHLEDVGVEVDVFDPWADAVAATAEYGIEIVDRPSSGAYDGIVIAVSHDVFRSLSEREIRAMGREKHVLYDLKHLLPATASDLRL